MPNTTDTAETAQRLLAVYLRDHDAGAHAGLALARRCQRANADNPLGALLADIVSEIAADRDSLHRIMETLDVAANPIKAVLGRAAERVGRLKSNGTLTRYSPSSRVVELEGLLAGVDGKRNLWRSLKAAAPSTPSLDTATLDTLLERADTQRERLHAAHDRAAAEAFNSN